MLKSLIVFVMKFFQRQSTSVSQSRSSETKDATLEEDAQATIADVTVHALTQVILHIMFV